VKVSEVASFTEIEAVAPEIGFVNVMTSFDLLKFHISIEFGANMFELDVFVRNATTFHVPKNPLGTCSVAEIPPEMVVAFAKLAHVIVNKIMIIYKNFFIFL
jgi:hypothetical protein